jgi:hypothetical protein
MLKLPEDTMVENIVISPFPIRKRKTKMKNPEGDSISLAEKSSA